MSGVAFSIVIPTFNAENTLARALDSIFAQQARASFEVIIADDASTDATIKIAQDYASKFPNIQLHKLDHNGGPGVARNLGIEKASGAWISFLDADDQLEDNFFTALNEAVQEASPDCDVIAFDGRLFSHDAPDDAAKAMVVRDDLGRLQSNTKQQTLTDYLLNRLDCSVIFHLFRKDFLDRNAIRHRAGIHEDVDFMFHALMRMNGITVVRKPLYRKHDTVGSIVNTLSKKHLDGYFDALEAMQGMLAKDGVFADFKKPFLSGVINVTSSRLMRLLRAKIIKQQDAGVILSNLFDRAKRMLDNLEIPLSRFKPSRAFRTKYQILFESFIQSMQAKEDSTKIIENLLAIQDKSWSCYDLHNSIFFAPTEIRTCCKRFFADGELKGDVVLLRGSTEEFKFSYEDILREKKQLHKEINRDNSPECRGCPFLTFENWGEPLNKGIKYISLEYHSVCNMRCTYCCDTYYGGQKATYDVHNVVVSSRDSGGLKECEYVVWGGGEPTVDQKFGEIATILSDATPTVRQRIITNSTLYSEAIADLLAKDRAFIVTSIDAGTEKTFRDVRKYKYLDRVLENLRRYRAISPKNMILKYIVLAENGSLEELQGFVDMMEKNDLLECNFQISCNFKTEVMDKEQLTAVAILYGLLASRGANFIFTDDLVWQRMPRMSEDTVSDIAQGMNVAMANPIIESGREEDVVVWGTGAQARILMEKSQFFKKTKVAYFVDPRREVIGKKFQGLPIHEPSILLQDNKPIVIAAVQSAPFIYQEIASMALNQDRVVRELLL